MIPGGVATIESGVFETCERLQQVIIEEGVTQIGDRAFKECVSLQKIVIPDSILLIGRDAFAECDRLREVELPVHLKGVCESAFPVHTKFHYRTSSRPSHIECLIQSLTDADCYDRYMIMETIRNAGEDGDVTAMMYMAKCYHLGRYLLKSETEARSWYEKAAAKGCLQAKMAAPFHEKSIRTRLSCQSFSAWYVPAAKKRFALMLCITMIKCPPSLMTSKTGGK